MGSYRVALRLLGFRSQELSCEGALWGLIWSLYGFWGLGLKGLSVEGCFKGSYMISKGSFHGALRVLMGFRRDLLRVLIRFL